MTEREKISEIISTGNIMENFDFIKEQIPEIIPMIGFEHKHPHHHLDVWNHTLKVVSGIKSTDLETKMAGFLHDIGKPFSYQDEEVRHFHGHPEVSAQMSEKILKRLGYDDGFIKNVCYLVRTHDTLIDPNHLDNSYQMVLKRLEIQYADARAHAPDKVEKKVKLLNKISEALGKR